MTLTTDFGHQDPYVAVVKGVILSGFPSATIVDLNHEIPPFDILAGAWSLKMSLSYFPSGTVHIAVVDPQVGSSQRRIALQLEDSIILAPDNGLMTAFVSRAKKAFVLDKSEFFRTPVSSTFHARDVFAPVAAQLLYGVGLEILATEIDIQSLAQVDGLEPTTGDGCTEGAVVYSDRYGNLITNISADIKSKIKAICVGGRLLTLASGSYDTVGDGDAQVVTGSHGYLEIAMKKASAQDFLKVKNGEKVKVETVC
ncbi:MAG: SAM-dependent chlorinase/fluorinase [Candidatus Melainabacteria bacterium]|nr:SAM-dependent chlorinase/fluorinase [Candidatus Melainabacteria bacterium]